MAEVWTCVKCRRPILDEEAVHGAYWDHEARTGAHYDCVRTDPERLRHDFEKFEESAERVRGLLGEIRDVLNRRGH